MTEKNKDKLVFVVGICSALSVSVIGRVYLGELIVFLTYILHSASFKQYKENSTIKKIIKLGFVWLASQLISDFFRDSSMTDTIKGSVSILFLIGQLPFAYWALKDKPKRWLIFFAGYVISTQINYYTVFSLTEFGSAAVWRVYSYVPLASFAAAWCYYKGKKKLAYIILLSFGFWTLFNESRNVFLTNTMTVVILCMIDKYNKADMSRSVTLFKRNIIKNFIILFIGLFAVDVVYENLASTGYLGDYAYEKYMKQKKSSAGMASGRLEFIMAMDLVSKSPIIGYGSYAKDRTNYVYNYYVEHNIDFNPAMFDYDVDSVANMLPRHSRIGGLWMWHGIGAGVFWIFILSLIFRIFKNGYIMYEPALLCLSVNICMQELWDTLFSPMSIRLPLLFFLSFIILCESNYKRIQYE